MIKNNKGSGLTWAVMIVMVLLLVVGGSLTFAYSNYNRSINNRNQLQCDLYAKSAVDAIVKAISENNGDSKKLIPESTGKENAITANVELSNIPTANVVIYKDDSKSYGDGNNAKPVMLIYIDVTYEYNDCTSHVQAVMQQVKGNWKVINYDGGDI